MKKTPGEKTWQAHAWMESNPYPGLAVVLGHPTRESAIEHLERLLGRDSILELIAKRAAR